MSEYYILDESRQLVPVDDYYAFFRWRDEEAKRRGQDTPTATLQVARDVVGDITVSTVFLGMNHSWDKGVPIVFETMVFGGHLDEYQWRYGSWDEAEKGHATVLAAALAGTEVPEEVGA